MSSENLELSGKLSEISLAELLVEATTAGLGGSFRLACGEQKIAVYLDKGSVIYAASNVRKHRLPECIARWGMFANEDLNEFRQAQTDFQWGERMITAGKLTKKRFQLLQAQQSSEILQTALLWTEGEWNFTPLVRLREDLHLKIDLKQLLVEAARKLPEEYVANRIASLNETFVPVPDFQADINLMPEEAFILSRFENALSLEEVKTLFSFFGAGVHQTLFVLWLGGFLRRLNYAQAFSEEKISQILSAKIALSKPSQAVISAAANSAAAEVPEKAEVSDAEDDETGLEIFLERVLCAKTYYQVLGIEQTSNERIIKQAYFAMAKRYHPDKFHFLGETEKRIRIQDAFARVAQAYETLKDAKSRELYDFKVRKQQTESNSGNFLDSPEAIFGRGLAALRNGDNDQAIALLSHAVMLSPETGRYHAHYARALATNPKFRHRAENEFQSAVKLEPQNTDIRLMIAEFYQAQSLLKRAEAELNRVLDFAPNNERARRLLDSLNGNG